MEEFELGRIAPTKSIVKRMKTDYAFNHFIDASLTRFQNCDWGNLSAEGNEGVENDGMIMGVYTFTDGQDVWIITEWDRHATTILYSHER